MQSHYMQELYHYMEKLFIAIPLISLSINTQVICSTALKILCEISPSCKLHF